MSEEIKDTEAVEPTPIEGGVEDVAVTPTAEVTPADQPELPPQVEIQNELIRQSVEALTNLTSFR